MERIDLEKVRRSRSLRLVGAELFRLRRRPMLWIMVAIQTGLCALMPMLFYLIYRTSSSSDKMSPSMRDLVHDRLSFPGTLTSSVASSLVWGLPLLVVLTASSFGGEFAWGTLRMLLSRGVGRREYCLTKAAALGVCWIFLFAVGTVSSLLMGALASTFAHGAGPSAIGPDDLATFGGYFLAGILAGSTYIALVGLFAVQVRSTVFAVAAGLGLYFGDRIIGGIASGLGYGPMEAIVRAGMNYNISSLIGEVGKHPNPTPLAIAILVVYSFAALLGAARLLSRHDVTVSGVG
ncbi:MAG: ABC transporter permease [Thermomicrobiales bacterium]